MSLSILSPLHDRKSVIVHHTEDELMESLKLVVLGSSSPLYIWNVPSESFVHKRSADIEQVIVRVSGQTEAAGTSYLRRFLNLGSLMRRMDIFVHDLRHRRDATSTVHAFAYGLSTLLNFFRHQISNTPLFKDHDFSISCDRAAEWLHCAEYEEIVNCLATMCHRHLDILPENYREFPTATVDILNVVYEMLEYHFKLASSHLLIAVIAYLLTVTSQPYLAELRQSVIHSKNRRWRAKLKEEVHVPGASVLFEGEEQEGTSEDDDSLEVDSSFPTFIPNDLADILPAAGRSLRLLEAAQPSHNLLSETAAPREILWLWSDAEIRHAWNDVHGLESVFTSLLIEPSLVKQTDDSSSVLDQFKVFVLEPGTRGSNEDEDRNARSL
ncbi:hypothetical protein ID866_7629 [Astraeus odoratus]|nr:hypothetical protein ID866_7629 [Astraeus odoratus]